LIVSRLIIGESELYTFLIAFGTMRRLSADAAGVMDMPMRLLIASVLTAMILPIFYSAYEDLSITRTEEELLEEIDGLLINARTLLEGGEGSRIETEFNVMGSMNSDPLKVIIGGPIQGDERWTSYTVGYSISGGSYRYVVSKPPVQITGNSMDGLSLSEGDHRLIMVHSVINGTHLIIVSL